MAFRDDHEAALARADALDRENAELRARIAKLEQSATAQSSVASTRGTSTRIARRSTSKVLVGGTLVAASGVGAGIATALLAGEPIVGTVIAIGAIAIAVPFLVVGSLAVVPRHDELLVIAGRRTLDASGQARPYRIARTATIPFPLIERVERMSLAAIPFELSVRGAYTSAGSAVDLKATGAVRIVDTPPAVYHAIDRFLGRPVDEIARVARETLEGHLRDRVATLTDEEITADLVQFADEVLGRADPDLEKLGLTVPELAIAREPE